MEVFNSPEILLSTSSNHDSDLNFARRRRPNAITTTNVADAPCSSESSGNEFAADHGARSESASHDGDGRGEKVRNGENRDIGVALKFSFRPSFPAHRRNKESPLSSDAIFKQSHAGLFNLCIVVLVAVNGRLIIENLMKYGLLIRAGFWFSSRSLRDWPLLMCCLSLPIFPLAAFVVERLVQKKYVSEPAVVCLHILITTSALLYPVFVILRCDSAVLSGVILMLFTCIVWLKLVSYAHTNYDMRALADLVEKGDMLPNSLHINYPDSVNLNTLTYFMVAPTLCYQLSNFMFKIYAATFPLGTPSYPRTAYVRKGWVIRQVVKLVIFTGLMGFIVEQYINPIVQNSQHPLKGNLLYALERVLKLSVPNLYVWLCMFYVFFHLWLNILAELLCFGDREFYKDWWNAKTVDEYWRMWNMPVHKWIVRHIYFPCLRNGISRGAAIVIAFLVSAIFHELCIAVPCHIFKLWAFTGIMLQVGNIMFWLFFCILGQPMCLLLYYHDLMNRKGKID